MRPFVGAYNLESHNPWLIGASGGMGESVSVPE